MTKDEAMYEFQRIFIGVPYTIDAALNKRYLISIEQVRQVTKLVSKIYDDAPSNPSNEPVFFPTNTLKKKEYFMRKILFRGQCPDKKTWVEGNFVYDPIVNRANIYCIDYNGGIEGMQFEHHVFDVIPETVGEFAGFTDKNNKRIFEGDIVRFAEWSKGKMCWIGVVNFNYGTFIVTGEPNAECSTPFEIPLSKIDEMRMEIIGNIHDNPKLLETEDV